MNLEDYAFGVARQKKLDESDVRYAMAATLIPHTCVKAFRKP